MPSNQNAFRLSEANLLYLAGRPPVKVWGGSGMPPMQPKKWNDIDIQVIKKLREDEGGGNNLAVHLPSNSPLFGLQAKGYKLEGTSTRTALLTAASFRT